MVFYYVYKGGIYIEQKINFYNKNEIKKLLKSNERLTYADDGITEVVIKYKDIPDFIVDYNDKFGITDLKFYDYEASTMNPIITTLGFFLDKCDREVRKDIIERLIYLQQGGKIKKYKVIDENDLEDVRTELNIKI